MKLSMAKTFGIPTAILLGCMLSGCGESPQQGSATLDVANIQGSSFDEPVAATPAPTDAAPVSTPAPEAAASTPVPIAVAAAPTEPAQAAPATPAAEVAQAVSPTATPATLVTAEDLPDDISKIPTATPPPQVAAASSTPVPAPPVATAPSTVAVPAPSGDFQPVTFETLSSFKYEEPIPQEGEKPEDVEKRRDQDQIPAEVKALNGQKAIVQGWMVPMEVNEDGSVKSFVLVKTQPQCCFGDMQAMNEWVDVVMDEGKSAEFNVDVPVKVYGQLEVGEKMQDGFVLSIYRLQGERLEL